MSSAPAKDDTENPAASPAAAKAPLFRINRVLSAAVLIPLALGAIYLGGWVYLGVLIAIAWLLAVEWCRVTVPARAKWFSLMMGGAVTAALFLTRFGAILPGLAVLTVAAPVLAVVARAAGMRGVWPAFGVVYIGLGLMAAEWLMAFLPGGRGIIVWTLLVIWATDTGAMTMGRLLGGPRLAPALSPKKTWSGAIGGLVLGAAVGAAATPWLFPLLGGAGVFLGVGVAILGQIGDLIESAVKRHFGIKDFGQVIPGHGGALDRLDSLLAVLPVVAVAAGVLYGVPPW